ncbi:MAG: PAS domain S-box protein [Sphingobium sp.]|nr:PAS domain S-box protein [Sphingobium sp.]
MASHHSGRIVGPTSGSEWRCRPRRQVIQELNDVGEPSAWLAAVVQNSFDAILSKTLDGTITSWNAAAEQLYGYTREEAIGSSISIIIPEDRRHEEADILARLRRGESIEHYETVRCHRDGHLIDIELTVSPVRDAAGNIVGASKIARDITERKQRAAQQVMLIREMHHRISNLLAVVQGMVTFSRRQAGSVDEFAANLSERIVALGAAHQLILPQPDGGPPVHSAALGDVIEAVLKPYAEAGRTTLVVSDLQVGPHALTSLALLLHELATNAVKYGGLSTEGGSLDIALEDAGDQVRLIWRETGGQAPEGGREGFGSDLLRVAIQSLDAQLERHWAPPTLTITVDMPRERLAT